MNICDGLLLRLKSSSLVRCTGLFQLIPARPEKYIMDDGALHSFVFPLLPISVVSCGGGRRAGLCPMELICPLASFPSPLCHSPSFVRSHGQCRSE